ncbi:MAG: gfo/Idh/MocA family oxidoreductase, partial [Planctomycetota bacterium]
NLLNTGPHPLDQALCLFGFDKKPDVHCVMDRVTNYGNAEDFVKLVLSGKGRPTIDLEIHSCDPYRQFVYKVCGEMGGLIGDTEQLKWQYYNKKKAPQLKLHRKPISAEDGSPTYCTDDLTWIKKSWKVPKSESHLFNSMAARFYKMLHKTLTEGAPLEITPEQVRMQIGVIEQCRKQNPQIYPKG